MISTCVFVAVVELLFNFLLLGVLVRRSKEIARLNKALTTEREYYECLLTGTTTRRIGGRNERP